MMLYRWPLLGLPTFSIGAVLTVVAAALTLFSMIVYIRAAWPSFKRAK
jgi:phosphatidylglycerophosphate synthase